jgi:hypothetical protein
MYFCIPCIYICYSLEVEIQGPSVRAATLVQCTAGNNDKLRSVISKTIYQEKFDLIHVYYIRSTANIISFSNFIICFCLAVLLQSSWQYVVLREIIHVHMKKELEYTNNVSLLPCIFHKKKDALTRKQYTSVKTYPIYHIHHRLDVSHQ